MPTLDAHVVLRARVRIRIGVRFGLRLGLSAEQQSAHSTTYERYQQQKTLLISPEARRCGLILSHLCGGRQATELLSDDATIH